MTSIRHSGPWKLYPQSRKEWTRFNLLLTLLLVLPGCIGPDRPPVSEIEVPTWEVGQEWHYKGSNGQWRNWTVVAIEERRGYETYRVQIEITPPDKFDREIYTRWYDQATLGTVELLKGESRDEAEALWGWGSKPIPPRFPLKRGNTTYTLNLTVVADNAARNMSVNGLVQVSGWTTIHVTNQMRDVVHLRAATPETNVREQYWYDPSVENWARYTADVESITFNLTSWENPG